MTPIQAWPPVRGRGAPGYSAKHFAAVLPPPSDDPLRVAERIQHRRNAECIVTEAKRRVEAGSDWSDVLDWQSRAVDELNQASWAALCVSFDLVISTLEGEKQTPAMKQLVRVAKRAARRAA